MKYFIITILATASVFMGMATLVPSAYAATDTLDSCDLLTKAEQNESDACRARDDASTNPIAGPDGILIRVTNIIALLAGLTAVIVIIIAGLQFVFAGGDAQKVSTARSAIIFAIVGLIVIVAARAIIAFVITEL